MSDTNQPSRRQSKVGGRPSITSASRVAPTSAAERAVERASTPNKKPNSPAGEGRRQSAVLTSTGGLIVGGPKSGVMEGSSMPKAIPSLPEVKLSTSTEAAEPDKKPAESLSPKKVEERPNASPKPAPAVDKTAETAEGKEVVKMVGSASKVDIGTGATAPVASSQPVQHRSPPSVAGSKAAEAVKVSEQPKAVEAVKVLPEQPPSEAEAKSSIGSPAPKALPLLATPVALGSGGGGGGGLSSQDRRPSSVKRLSIDTSAPIPITSREPYKSPAASDAGGGSGASGGVSTPHRKSFSLTSADAPKGRSERRSRLRGSISLPLSSDLTGRVQSLLGNLPDTGELLRVLGDSVRKAQQDAASSGGEQPPDEAKADQDRLTACWVALSESKPHKLLQQVKDSLARVYVLTTARHLVQSLIDAKEEGERLKKESLNLKALLEVLTKALKALTAFTSPSRPGQPQRRDSDRPFFRAVPVPALVAKYFRDVHFLGQTFVALVRATLKLLILADDQVRAIILDNAQSGVYFFNSKLLKNDLETVWEYLGITGLYLEFYGQLSRDALLLGALPFTPLTKLEVFGLISVGYAQYKLRGPGGGVEGTPGARRASLGSGSASTAKPLSFAGDFGGGSDEMEPDTMEIIRQMFFTEDPFRCSPFLVTFAAKSTDVRPSYETMSKDPTKFPQLFLSLSRQLYVSRCTQEGLEDYFRQHYSVVHDYLMCTQLTRIAEAATGEVDPVVELTQRTCGNWTANLYADITVSDFISRFYQDFLRRISTDQSVLTFSKRYTESQRVQQLRDMERALGLPETGNDRKAISLVSREMKKVASGGASATKARDDSFKVGKLTRSLRGSAVGEGGGMMMPGPGGRELYILNVSERALDGLRLAEMLMLRDPICACEMAESIVMWYILWARASLSRCVSSMHKAPETGDKGAGFVGSSVFNQVFDSLRRVCGLCSDVNGIAQVCDDMVSKMREREATSSPAYATFRTRTPSTPSYYSTVNGSSFLGAGGGSSMAPNSPSQGHRTQRKGFIVSPHGRSMRNSMLSKGGPASPGGESTMGRRALGSMTSQGFSDWGSMGGGPVPVASPTGDGEVTGQDVILSDLVAMGEDLKLLAAECLEHATELVTRLSSRICREKLGRASNKTSRPSIFRRQTSSLRGSDLTDAVHHSSASAATSDGGVSPHSSDGHSPKAAAGGVAGVMRLSIVRMSRASATEADGPLMPRPWALELKGQVLQPLATFCRTDQFCSSCLLPRLVEAVLHSVLEILGQEPPGRLNIMEGKALHADFLSLKEWTELEQGSQAEGCKLSDLAVFDRMHVIVNVLTLPPSLMYWNDQDRAALYLLPDAPKWISLRADKGRVSYPVLRKLSKSAGEKPGSQQGGGPEGQAEKRLSKVMSTLDSDMFERRWSTLEQDEGGGGDHVGYGPRRRTSSKRSTSLNTQIGSTGGS